MRTLLLADDNITVQRVIALTFAREPITVVTASDGRQAIDRMASARPDIVLAATSLPQVSGYELARYVRNQPELQHIPVLVLSGAFETVDQAQLAASGANGVIEKPVEPADVISRVNDLLGLGTTGVASGPGGRLVPPPAHAPAEPKLPAALPRAVTSTRPIPPHHAGPGRLADYRDSLDEAFDTLDDQLAGRNPIGTSSPPARPSAAAGPESANPVYEVDAEWFGDGGTARAEARAGRRDDPSAPELAGTGSAAPVYEVDEEWFAEDEQARAAQTLEQEQLAKEMGLDEVILPERPAPLTPSAPPPSPRPVVEGVAPATREPAPDRGIELPSRAEPLADTGFTAEPVARPLPIALFLGGEPSKPAAAAAGEMRPRAPFGPDLAAPEPLHVLPPPAHAPATGVLADDFEALLAFEQGEKDTPPMMQTVIQPVAPAITGDMLDRIATLVADRLKPSVRVEAPPPEISGAMLDQVAATVAERLKSSVQVEPVAPPITDAMLAVLARRVADQLATNVRVEPAAPEITNEMLDRIAGHVGERVRAGFTRDQLRDAFGESIRQTVGEMVRQVVSQTSERLVREEIERIKAQAQQS